MQLCDLKAFTQLMKSLGELYSKQFSNLQIDLYWNALERFEFIEVRQALNAHIANPDVGAFFPKPGDIVRYIEGSGEARALQAWAEVEKSIREVGGYESVAFADPLIHAVIEAMGGWVELCSVSDKELPFRAAEFQKRYRAFVCHAPTRYPSYLPGRCDTQNTHQGYAGTPPVAIGDFERVVQVISGGGGLALPISRDAKKICACLPALFHSDTKS